MLWNATPWEQPKMEDDDECPCCGGIPMKEYWINVYADGHFGLPWRQNVMAISAGRSWLLNILNRGKPIYRIHVRMKK